MPESHQTHLGVLKSLHLANYELFRVKTENEVVGAIKACLSLSQLTAGYYQAQGDGLQLVGFFASPKGNSLPDFPEHIATLPSDEFGISSLEDQTTLPMPLLQALMSEGCITVADIPVKDNGQTIGLLIIGAKPGQTLSQETLDPFFGLAESIPLALEKVRANNAMQQRLRELEGISSVGQAISSASSLDKLYEITHQQIREAIGEVSIIFALYDKPTDTIQIPYRYEDGEYSTIESFPLGEGLTSILVRSGQPLMIVEDTERRTAELGAKIVGKTAKSWLGCPLIVGGEAIGAIIIQDTEQEKRFNQDDMRFITSLSAQTAGAIFNARLLEETRQRALQLQTAAEISRDVSGSLIVDDLLQKSVNLIKERFSFYHAAIFLIDASGQFASIREATGKVGLEMKQAGHKLQVGSNSIVGYVTRRGEPLIVNETEKSTIHFPNPLLPETRSEAAIPVKAGERIIGALDVQSKERFSFNEENIKIIHILADQIGIAIVNSELYAEAQERLSQHRLLHHVTTSAASSTTIDEALKSAVQGLQVTLGGDQVSILMLDHEGNNLQVRSAVGYTNDVFELQVPVGDGITGWAAKYREVVRIGDVREDTRFIGINEQTRSEMAIPLIYRNEVLGVLNVESSQVNAYNESVEEMIGTLAGSLAAIIAHSRLLEQYRRQLEHDRLLYDITGKIRRTSNVQSILEIAANEIYKAVGAERARIKIDIRKDTD